MAREIMFVIRHGIMKKVWIDPVNIFEKSDVPFVAPDYPTKEMIAEKEKRMAINAKLREADQKKQQHDDWNEPKIAVASKPGVKPVAKEVKEPKVETKKTKQRKGARK